MNTKLLDKIIKSRDDKNKKASLPEKVLTGAIVLSFGLFITVQKEYEANKNQVKN